MKLLERLVRAMLVLCILALGGYIILRAVTIAGENGVFRHSPMLSALYRVLEKTAEETYLPVFSYLENGQAEKNTLEHAVTGTVYPLAWYESQQEGTERKVESAEEYDMIVAAEAEAEDERHPLDLEEWLASGQEESEESGSENGIEDENGESTSAESSESSSKETENGGQDESGANGSGNEEIENDGLEQTRQEQFEALLYHYFSMDETTTIDSERLNADLLAMDLTLDKSAEGPQILIYHTHSQEAFADSVEGDDTTTIVGVGDYLTELLTEEYGYQVIHDRDVYDLVDGVLDRNAAYDYSGQAVDEWLEQYPQIQVVIDLHRDGVDGKRFVTEYQGEPAAQLMFIVGMSRTADGQDISYLPNPYVEENLAFALQMEVRAEEDFPGLMRNIYLMAYRFNLHCRPRSLLLEAGTQLNTLEEEKTAMEAFAALLDGQLKGN